MSTDPTISGVLTYCSHRSKDSVDHVALETIQRQLQALPGELSAALRGWHNASMEDGCLLDLSNHINQHFSEGLGAVVQRPLPLQNFGRNSNCSSKPDWTSPASRDSLKGCTRYLSLKEECDIGYRPYKDVACFPDCSCDCHTPKKAKSYSVSSFIFGSMFIGFRTLTSSTRPCNNQRCCTSRRMVTYTYTFPSWLLYRAITATIANFRSRGPELNLRLMNVVDRRNRDGMLYNSMPWPEDQILCELKRQLDTGEASIFDIDMSGTSSLLVSHSIIQVMECTSNRRFSMQQLFKIGRSSSCSFATVQIFIIRTSTTGNLPRPLRQTILTKKRSAYEYMWALYLERQIWLKNLPPRLLPIFSFSRACELLEFTKLHKAYLDRRSRSFGQVLQSVTRIEVDAQDRFGRTVLSWAAGHDDVETVQSLLLCGANPNDKDRCGETPLHHASRLCAERSVKLLLSAKADPLLMDAGGYTPMDVASTELIMKYLTAAGSRWGPRISNFNGSVLARQELFLYVAFLAGSDSANDPKYNMRAWSGYEITYRVSGVDNPKPAVDAPCIYVALRLSSRSHIALLESHLEIKPFEPNYGPDSDDWSIYHTEEQVAPEAYYVILRGNQDPAKPRKRKAGKKRTAFEEARRGKNWVDYEHVYIGPVGKPLERWFDEFKQRVAYAAEKHRKWKQYWGFEVWETAERHTPVPDSQLEGCWGLGTYYAPRYPYEFKPDHSLPLEDDIPGTDFSEEITEPEQQTSAILLGTKDANSSTFYRPDGLKISRCYSPRRRFSS